MVTKIAVSSDVSIRSSVALGKAEYNFIILIAKSLVRIFKS